MWLNQILKLEDLCISLPIARECKEEMRERRIVETSVLVSFMLWSIYSNVSSNSSLCLNFRILVYYTQKEAVPQKKTPRRSSNERPCSYADGNSGKGNVGRFQSSAFKSFGTQRKDNKEILFDMKEQQVQSLALDFDWRLLYILALGFLQSFLGEGCLNDLTCCLILFVYDMSSLHFLVLGN